MWRRTLDTERKNIKKAERSVMYEETLVCKTAMHFWLLLLSHQIHAARKKKQKKRILHNVSLFLGRVLNEGLERSLDERLGFVVNVLLDDLHVHGLVLDKQSRQGLDHRDELEVREDQKNVSSSSFSCVF
jgi:hypothetical protein